MSTLKQFLLLVFAILAVGGITATSAVGQAQFTASEYPATGSGTGEQKIGDEEVYFEAVGRKIECEALHASGALTEPSSELLLTGDLTDHPQGGNCRAGGTLVTTVNENSCTVNATALGTGAGETYAIGADLICPEGQKLEVKIRNVLNTTTACEITVFPQTVNGTFTAVNNSGHVDVSGTVAVNSTIHSNSTLLCGVESGTSKEVTTNLVSNRVVTIEAEVPVAVSH